MKVLHIGWGFVPWRGGGLIEYAEDLMRAQVSLGYDVAYFCSGRHYPFFRQPLLKRWSRDGVRMYELLNCAVHHAGHLGTRDPESDLNERTSEPVFEDVLDEWQPNILHIQELAGFPSSLIIIAKSRGLPVVMTMQDYFPLCPTLKLLDYSSQLCMAKDVGSKCAICCAQAPVGRSHLIRPTIRYEVARHLKSGSKVTPWIVGISNLMRRHQPSVAGTNPRGQVASYGWVQTGQEEAYQRRRDVNINRLNMADLLIGQSHRLSEIYRTLGVQPEKIRTVQLTLEHLSRVHPILLPEGRRPITFATMNGCASVAKGAGLILEALRMLQEWSLDAKFRLIIMGSINPEFRQHFMSFANVICRGQYDRNNLDRLLEQADVGIVPSIWEEAYGYVGVEFLAKGIPVIGNRMGGIVDYALPGESGWINADNSAKGLANIMASLIRSPEQILRINQNIVANRARIIKPMNTHVVEMDAIYRGVLSSNPPLSGT